MVEVCFSCMVKAHLPYMMETAEGLDVILDNSLNRS